MVEIVFQIEFAEPERYHEGGIIGREMARGTDKRDDEIRSREDNQISLRLFQTRIECDGKLWGIAIDIQVYLFLADRRPKCIGLKRSPRDGRWLWEAGRVEARSGFFVDIVFDYVYRIPWCTHFVSVVVMSREACCRK